MFGVKSAAQHETATNFFSPVTKQTFIFSDLVILGFKQFFMRGINVMGAAGAWTPSGYYDMGGLGNVGYGFYWWDEELGIYGVVDMGWGNDGGSRWVRWI